MAIWWETFLGSDRRHCLCGNLGGPIFPRCVAVIAVLMPLLANCSSASSASTPPTASPSAAPTAPIGTQLAQLKGSDTVAADYFGLAVAVSGTTTVVGAPLHAKVSGRVYVFSKQSGGWRQVAELKGSDTIADDSFGDSVAISGSTLLVGYGDLYGGPAYVARCNL